MTEYIINKFHKVCSFRPAINTITIGMQDTEILTDDELSEYVSDCLTHEYMHKVLFDMYGNEVSSLFDAKEYLFRDNELHEKILLFPRWSYQSYIKTFGFNAFLRYYGLDEYDILQANIVCNTRRVITKNPINGHQEIVVSY